MEAREAILAAVRRNLPRPAVPLPELPSSDGSGIASGLGFREHLTKLPVVRGLAGDGDSSSSVASFQRQLEAMGGRSFEVSDAAAARAKIAELFPSEKVICSATPEVPGSRRIQDVRNPHELNDVEVGLVRSPLGVAETGAIWLTDADLVVNALGVLSQHLVVLLAPTAIIDTIQEAYEQIDLAASPYGLFMAGPSATADIEGVIVHGAQGARSLTVLLVAEGRLPPPQSHDKRERVRPVGASGKAW
jgi:L-lactate dehydrogenase complex protein LldG